MNFFNQENVANMMLFNVTIQPNYRLQGDSLVKVANELRKLLLETQNKMLIKHLTNMSLSVSWTIQNMPNALVYMIKEILKQNIENATYFLWAVYDKVQKQKADWRQNYFTWN